MLLLCSLLCCPLWAQHSNDICEQAATLNLSLPSPCPETAVVADTFELSLAGATASAYLDSSPCTDDSVATAGGDIWVKFMPMGNTLTAALSGLEQPHLRLFRGGDCGQLIPVGCAAGESQATLLAYVTRNTPYYLLLSGSGSSASLILSGSNDCSPCHLVRDGHFTATPAPDKGRYPSGTQVEMCFTVDRWSTPPNSELLHALELQFGPGWDMSTFSPEPPNSCSDNGNWDWYNGWVSAATGAAFGPGFAFDAIENGVQDGNPGNNEGLDGLDCSNIGGPDNDNALQFCWTLTTADCPPEAFGYPTPLNITARLLGDGLSGSGTQTACYHPEEEYFDASLYCPDAFAPDIQVFNASCGTDCDGYLALSGAGGGPWDYVLSDTSGTLLYLGTSIPGPDTVTGLCPGLYEVLIVDNATNEARSQLVSVQAGLSPTASASFVLPCFEGEPIALSAQVTPSDGEISYSWTGPNGFVRNTADPLALFPGTYTLQATVEGCASPLHTFTIPSVSEVEIAELGPDTLTLCPGDSVSLVASGNADSLTWRLNGSDAVLSTADSIAIAPTDGQVYTVEGINAAGCTGTDYVYIDIPFAPSVAASPAGTLCPGATLNLSASQGVAWSWSTGDTTSQITVAPTATTTYTLTVTSSAGCEQVRSYTAEVATSTGFFVFGNQAICAGESAVLAASGGASFLWSTGETTNSITVSPEETQSYTVNQTDEFGCTHTDTVTVTVNSAPDIAYVPQEVLICAGDEVLLELYQADTLLWDSLVSPVEDAEYLPPFDFGCRSLPSFQVYVSPLPDVSITGPDTLCGPDSVLLTGTGTGLLEWGNGTTEDSLWVYPETATAYTLTATDTLIGCTQTDTLTIMPLPSPSPPAVNCESRLGAVRFSWPFDPSLDYSVEVADGPQGLFQSDSQYVVLNLEPAQAVTINLTLQNTAGCDTSVQAVCASPDCDVLDLFTLAPDALCTTEGSIALLADVAGGTDEGAGTWSGPGVGPAGPFFDPIVAGTGTHTVVYTYTDNGCTLNDTTEVAVSAPLDAAAITCTSAGDSLAFTWPARPQDTAYSVQTLSGPGGMLSGNTYTVAGLAPGDTVQIELTVFSGGPCGSYTRAATCTLQQQDCPEINLPADTFSCAGSPVAIPFTDTLGWQAFDWSPAAGLSCTDCPAPIAAPDSTTTYQLVASDGAGCADTATFTVYVQEFPESYLPDTAITFCPGEPFELCMPDGDIHYWIGPNAFISANQCLSFDSITTADAGNYFAFMRANGCRFLKPITLVAAPPLAITDITEWQSVCANDTFSLSATVPNAAAFSWSPAEYLNCPDCAATTGSVPQTATFVLTATDTNGCTASANALVFVDDCAPAPRPGTAPGNAPRLRVYPNPATRLVTVETQLQGPKTLQVWNSSGQIIQALSFEAARQHLTLQGLPHGTYFLKLFNQQTVEQARLIVQ